MAGLGRFNLRDLEKFRDKIQRMGETETEAFIQACAKELAGRLLRKIIKRTDKVTVTGNLRRGWTGQTKTAAKTYAEQLQIQQEGDRYVIEIINPVEYAKYVEYGHRTVDHKKWVMGKFIMTISEQELKEQAPAILEKKIAKFLERAFHD